MDPPAPLLLKKLIFRTSVTELPMMQFKLKTLQMKLFNSSIVLQN